MPAAERRNQIRYLNTIDRRIRRPITEHLAECVPSAARLDPELPPIDGRPPRVAPGPTVLDEEDTVGLEWFRVTRWDREALWR